MSPRPAPAEMGERYVLCNGEPAARGLVKLDADDEGLLLGRAAFETLRTYDRALFGLEAHLDRLLASCIALNIAPPNIETVATELMGVTDELEGEAVARVTITAGGTRIVRAAPLPEVPHPFRCVTREWVPPPWLDGTVKHTSRAFSRIAVLQAGVEEVIWTDQSGYMLEGTRSNVFAVVGEQLVTPAVDGRFLAGVTRSAVLDSADDLGLEVCLRPIHLAESVDELYVCSTLKELTPITELNGAKAAGAGPIGQSVLDAFHEAIRSGNS